MMTEREAQILKSMKDMRESVLDHRPGSFDTLFRANLLAHIQEIIDSFDEDVKGETIP